jgi:hypothetical protein
MSGERVYFARETRVERCSALSRRRGRHPDGQQRQPQDPGADDLRQAQVNAPATPARAPATEVAGSPCHSAAGGGAAPASLRGAACVWRSKAGEGAGWVKGRGGMGEGKERRLARPADAGLKTREGRNRRLWTRAAPHCVACTPPHCVASCSLHA